MNMQSGANLPQREFLPLRVVQKVHAGDTVWQNVNNSNSRKLSVYPI